jgi:NAD-dependent SIR2 family protein deacetylase
MRNLKCSHCGKTIRKDQNKFIMGNEEFKICSKCAEKIFRFIDNRSEGCGEATLTTRKRSKYKIQEYGEDRIKQEYTVDGLTAREIATNIGISNASMSKYINQKGFKRANKRETSDSKSDKESHTCGVV